MNPNATTPPQWATANTEPVRCDIAKATSAGDTVVLSFGTVTQAGGRRAAQLVRQITLAPAVADNLRNVLRQILADGTLHVDQS